MDTVVEVDETIYRCVKMSVPNNWKDTRPSSALFKDSNGVSVDRDGKRDFNEILIQQKRVFGNNIKAIVSLKVQQCLEAETIVTADPVEENIYHALILDSPGVIPITARKARQLALTCNINYLDEQILNNT